MCTGRSVLVYKFVICKLPVKFETEPVVIINSFVHYNIICFSFHLMFDFYRVKPQISKYLNFQHYVIFYYYVYCYFKEKYYDRTSCFFVLLKIWKKIVP